MIVVEGANKAIVTYQNIGYESHRMCVVGVPSKTPAFHILETFQNCSAVYLCLDPDAYVPTKTKNGKIVQPSVYRVANRIGIDRAWLVELPVKADDFFMMGGDMHSFFRYIRLARRIEEGPG